MNIYQPLCNHTFSKFKRRDASEASKGEQDAGLATENPLLQRNLVQVPPLHQLSNLFLDMSFEQSMRSRYNMTKGLTRLLHNFSKWNSFFTMKSSCSNTTLHLHNKMFQKDHLLQQSNHRNDQMLLLQHLQSQTLHHQRKGKKIIFSSVGTILFPLFLFPSYGFSIVLRLWIFLLKKVRSIWHVVNKYCRFL